MKNAKPLTDDGIAYLRTQLSPQTPEYVYRLLARIEEDAEKIRQLTGRVRAGRGRNGSGGSS